MEFDHWALGQHYWLGILSIPSIYKYTKYNLSKYFFILLSLLYCYSEKLLVLGTPPPKGRPWSLMHSLFTDVHFTVISSVNTGIKTQRLEQVVACSKFFLVWMTLSVVLTWRKSSSNVPFFVWLMIILSCGNIYCLHNLMQLDTFQRDDVNAVVYCRCYCTYQCIPPLILLMRMTGIYSNWVGVCMGQ